MGLKGWLNERIATQTQNANEFWDSSVPPIGVLVQEEKAQTGITNKYELYEAMEDGDPELAGTLDDLAALVAFYYNGVYVDLGEEPEEKGDEKKLKKRLKLLEEDWDIISFIENSAHKMLRDGDTFYKKTVIRTIDGDEVRRVPAPFYLPRPYASLSKTRLIKEAAEDFIQYPRWLALNKYHFQGSIWVADVEDVQWFRYIPLKRKDIIFPAQILHFSMRPNSGVVIDQYGSKNLNCISKSPLLPMELLVKYKRHSILFDMTWREANVPFIHHKVDLSAFDPTRFPGETQKDKIDASEALGKEKLESYRDSIAAKARDQGLCTPNTTEIVTVEPKTRNYASPNENLGQINNSISSRLGSLMRHKTSGGGSYAADLLLSSITEPRLRVVASKIFKILVDYIREFLSEEFKDKKVLRQIKIRTNLILPHERLDRTREVLFMMQSKAFLIDEQRNVLGLLPLTKKERELLKKEQEEINKSMKPLGESDKSAGDTAGDSKRGGSKANDKKNTPHSDRDGNK